MSLSEDRGPRDPTKLHDSPMKHIICLKTGSNKVPISHLIFLVIYPHYIEVPKLYLIFFMSSIPMKYRISMVDPNLEVYYPSTSIESTFQGMDHLHQGQAVFHLAATKPLSARSRQNCMISLAHFFLWKILTSGKHSYGKSPFLMGKSTIHGHFQFLTKTPKVSRLVRFFLGCACTFLRARQYLPARRCHQASRRSRTSLWMADRDSHHLGSDIPSKSIRKPKKNMTQQGL